jgi:DNA-3-methyladenine glycosylase
VVTAGVIGRITEVEAYREDDPASHSHRGPTPRCASMFGAAGTLYVYLSYGIHHCLNVVTGPVGSGQAVLIRSLDIVDGLDIVRARRGGVEDSRLARGPGNVAAALGIDRRHDATSVLGGGPVTVMADSCDPPAAPTTTPRIGISKAADRLWRFVA